MESVLEAQLREYVSRGYYPFHMPGHKRQAAPGPDLPFERDLTEVEGADDLHHAEGILREAMDRSASLFGSRRTWFLVNGSTCGNLAGIRAAAPYGAEVIAARNCHKSVFHAMELGNLRVHWVYPQYDAAFDICGSIRPCDVQEMLNRFPSSRCVIVTSPTYEGVLSDIASIAAVCHAHGVPLLVDEAHGAHLGLPGEAFRSAERPDAGGNWGGFPDGAVRCGADLVVQSAHKTLPSLTQTAFLHLGGTLLQEQDIEQQLNIFETSSPSYPLMESLDGCTGILRERGEELFARWEERLNRFDAEIRTLRFIRALCHGKDAVENHPAFFSFDRSKILIRAAQEDSARTRTGGTAETARPAGRNREDRDTDVYGMNGAALADLLQKRYGLVMEMHEGRNVLAMTSCCDSDGGFARLTRALTGIDEALYDSCGTFCRTASKGANADMGRKKRETVLPEVWSGRSVCTIAEAVRAPHCCVGTKEAPGRTAAEYIYPYPPGIPLVIPGEVITHEKIQYLRQMKAQGAKIIRTGECRDGVVRVLK